MKRATIALLSLTISALALAHPELGAAAQPTTTNLRVPFSLTVEGATELILVSGFVHIVTELHSATEFLDSPSSSSFQVHTNFVDTTAVGITTGVSSAVSGSQSVNFRTADLPTDGNILMVVFAVLKESVKENRADLKHRLDLLARLKFDEKGILTAVELRDILSLPCL